MTLIEKLEAATEGSRELDAEIAHAVTFNADHADLVSRRSCACSPHYTTSIDAALTLVPKDCTWSLDSTGYAIVMRPGLGFLSERGDEEFHGRNDEKALAVCIAALKARLS